MLGFVSPDCECMDKPRKSRPLYWCALKAPLPVFLVEDLDRPNSAPHLPLRLKGHLHAALNVACNEDELKEVAYKFTRLDKQYPLP